MKLVLTLLITFHKLSLCRFPNYSSNTAKTQTEYVCLAIEIVNLKSSCRLLNDADPVYYNARMANVSKWI